MKVDPLVSGMDGLSGSGQYHGPKASEKREGFSQILENDLDKLNSTINSADEQAKALATGKEVDVSDAMIAITKADISFKLFLQLRNRAISAYEEIMRLQF